MTFKYKKNLSLSRQLERLRKANSTGSKILMGVLVFNTIYSTIKTILSGSPAIQDWLSVGLMCVTLFIAFFWLWSPLRNIRLAEDWLADSASSSNPQSEWITAIGIAILFAALMLTAFQPLVYALIFIFYSIVYLMGVRHYHGKLHDAFAGSIDILKSEKVKSKDEKELRDIYLEAITELKHYHEDYPHQGRVVSFLVIGIISAVLCVLDGRVVSIGKEAAIVLISLNPLIAEFVIIKWRSNRDNNISILENKRGKCENRLGLSQ
ncbi:hypothetical protein ACFL4L_07625 [bacterium]